jgi:hypothetical protein
VETVEGLLQVGHLLVMEEVYRSVRVWRPKGIKRAIQGI